MIPYPQIIEDHSTEFTDPMLDCTVDDLETTMNYMTPIYLPLFMLVELVK